MQFNIGSSHLTASQLARLRRDWVTPVPPEVILRSLRGMDLIITAVTDGSDEVVGMICGFTDQVLVAYIWDLEVVPEFRGTGLERELVSRFVAAVGGIHQINAHPSVEQVADFEGAGFTSYRTREAVAMTIQHLERQAG